MQFLKSLLLSAYSCLWRLAGPVLKRHKRISEGFDERLAPDDWPVGADAADIAASYAAPNSLRVWIQAASGGEAWLVHSLVRALAGSFEDQTSLTARPLHILCTSCTRQGLEVLERMAIPGPVALPRFFPLDRPDIMEKAMRQADPHLVILLETELWPGLLEAAKKQGVPVMALNARMTRKSMSAYGLVRSFWQEFAPERVMAISEADASRFAELFGDPARVSVMPNMKFDRMAEELPDDMGAALRDTAGIPQECLLAVLASVREEEENLLLPALKDVYGERFNGSRVILAVAPRHMHRTEAWRHKLAAAGLPTVLRSQMDQEGRFGSSEKDCPLPVILWDTFGELGALYSVADAVFVGGSLVPLGGQNFLEPAARGVTALVGPHTDNFLWIGEDFFDQGLAQRIHQGELAEALKLDLVLRLQALKAYRDRGGADWPTARAAVSAEVRERFAAWLAPHQGGSRQAARAITEKLLALFPPAG